MFRSLTSNRYYYLWILLVALVLRVIWAIAVPTIPISDSNAYDTFAQNIANCQNYGWDCNSPSAYWPVGISFVYALFYKVFGHTYIPIVIFHILVAVLTVGLSMNLAQMLFDRRIAAITGILLALWPSQIQFVTVLASELIFTCLVVAALALWLKENINLWLRSAIVGLTLAAASYIRPTALLIPAIFLFIRYIKKREIVRSLSATFIMFALMGLLIAPWSIRNTQVFGQFVLISTNGGANLWMGNNPESAGGYMPLPPEVKEMNEAQRNKYLKSIAVAHIKEKPFLFLTRAVRRAIATHSRESISVVWNKEGLVLRYGQWILLPLKIVNLLYWLSMLFAGIVGIFCLGVNYRWSSILTHPTVLIWGYFAGVHAVVVAQDRYHFPSIPMIAILAALAIVFFLDRGWEKKKQKPSPEIL